MTSNTQQALARSLEHDLRREVRGEVRFDSGSRALYATDLSIYRQMPIGVVIPRDAADVVAAVDACRSHGVPILGRGCGTSLAGQCCNVAVVIDFSKYMNRILDIDPDSKTATVEPGVICDQLRNTAEEYHLTFAPDPATHKYCTLGGMIGNNSCGVHSVMGGRTVDNVEELEILTYDGLKMRVGRTNPAELKQINQEGGRRGEVYSRLGALRDRYADEIRHRYPKIPRRVSGYNLDELLPDRRFNVARALVGTESTCAIILGATLRLLHSPPYRSLLVLSYPSLPDAGDAIPEVLSTGPIGLEGVHVHVIENMQRKHQAVEGARLLPDGNAWLLVEFGGESRQDAHDHAAHAIERLKKHPAGASGMKIFDDAHEQQQIWHIRESGVAASRVPGIEDSWPSWEDAAVAPDKLGNYLRDFDALLRRYEYAWTIYGHFGDGCIHCRITFDLKTSEGVRKFRSFMAEGASLVVRYGGSLSGEHGDGQARAELLPMMFGSELIGAFREFKRIWDPHGKMNPGKVVDPYRLDENLRLGPDYKPRPVFTHFRFPEDKGSFSLASERCFGVGKCRGLDGGTMCPSFMATREEMHTTRGRAHLLFEMLRGDSILDGWRDEHVKDALDLCLACKGCKGDCPVAVDMATYKAEFLSHYYEGRLRPRPAYAMGWIHRWARLGSFFPELFNVFSLTPVLSDLLKRATGIAVERNVPALSSETFVKWFHNRPPANGPSHTRTVMLWPDTFTNYFEPHVGQAAVEVLENAGCSVIIPERNLCCGRPFYDYGMLPAAKRSLRQILSALRPALNAGIPVIGLEPSCVSVFRDEMTNLFPNVPEAQQLRERVVLLSEFLNSIPGYEPPRLERKAIVHGHCHQKALMGLGADERILGRMGMEFQTLDSGCCGMAGSFGYEKDHYDVSMKIGERVLLPAIRQASKGTIILANGFSCRSQIQQGSDRRALHLAELLRMALREGRMGPPGAYPEAHVRLEQPPSGLSRGAIAAMFLTGALTFALTRRRSD
jgi:FAD/FMN-containing dehydrogenase/Fe-S oxidoreductase